MHSKQTNVTDFANRIVFVVALLVIAWLLMLTMHEFGHAVTAILTGGTVEQIVLHPFTISRTDVRPNPFPMWVVWMGPVTGCALPTLLWRWVPAQLALAKSTAGFIAGFCLVANGAYIGVGSIDAIGDCKVMLMHGAPRWSLMLFGFFTTSAGLLIWHQLGSVRQLFARVSPITATHAWTTLSLAIGLALLLAIAFPDG